MKKPTPGWKILRDSQGKVWAIGSEAGLIALMTGENIEANADLIVALYNAAYQINPDNPMAVAEALPELVKATKEALRQLEAFFDKAYRGDPYDGRPRNKLEIQLRAALAKLEAKP